MFVVYWILVVSTWSHQWHETSRKKKFTTKEDSLCNRTYRCKCNPIFWFHQELFPSLVENIPKWTIAARWTTTFRNWIDTISRQQRKWKAKWIFWHMWTNDVESIWNLSHVLCSFHFIGSIDFIAIESISRLM